MPASTFKAANSKSIFYSVSKEGSRTQKHTQASNKEADNEQTLWNGPLLWDKKEKQYKKEGKQTQSRSLLIHAAHADILILLLHVCLLVCVHVCV